MIANCFTLSPDGKVVAVERLGESDTIPLATPLDEIPPTPRAFDTNGDGEAILRAPTPAELTAAAAEAAEG